MRFFVFILWGMVLGALQAQNTPATVSGKVVDAKTGESLPYVNIYVKNSHIGTVSNIEGDFRLNIPNMQNNDTIVFSFVGYNDVQMPIADWKPQTIYLQPYIQQVKKVDIRAKRPDAYEILTKTFLRTRKHIVHDTVFLFNVFYKNFIRTNDQFIYYRKVKAEIAGQHDRLWFHTRGNIVGEKAYSKIGDIMHQYKKKNKIVTFFEEITTPPFLYSTRGNINDSLKFNSFLHKKRIVEIDTVLFYGHSKIYVIDYYHKKMSKELVHTIKQLIDKNTEPYRLFFDDKLHDMSRYFQSIKQIFRNNLTRLYVDANNNYNIIKKIDVSASLVWAGVTVKTFEYNITEYTNTDISYPKYIALIKTAKYTKRKKKPLIITSLHEEHIYNPRFGADTGGMYLDSTLFFKILKDYDFKSYDHWENTDDYLKPDRFEQMALAQIRNDDTTNLSEIATQFTSKDTSVTSPAPKNQVPSINISLTGTVIDSVTRQPIEFCNIVFKNITDTTQKPIGCITNTDGKFKIAIPFGYNYLVQVSMVGYKTESDTAYFQFEDGDDTDIDYSAIPEDALKLEVGNITLLPDSNLLNTVTVRESAKKMDIDKQTVVVTKKLRENTIAAKDVLNKLDGITYNRLTNELKVDNNKQVKILVDGVEKDRNYILNLNPKRIKKIEILRNITGIYQIEGYNAVVNIITYDNYRGYDFTVEDQYMHKYEKSNQPFFLQNDANVNLTVTRDKWNYHMRLSNYYNEVNLYNRTITDYTTTGETIINGSTDNPNALNRINHYRLHLGVDYKIDKKQIIGIEAGLTGFPANNYTQSLSFDTIISKQTTAMMQSTMESYSAYNTLSGNVYYKNNIDSSSKLVSYIYTTNTQTKMEQQINSNRLNYNKISSNLNSKIEYQKTIKQKYTFTSGGRFLSNNFSSMAQDSRQADFNSKFYKLTGYAYLKIKFNKTTGLLLGSSVEHYQSSNNTLNSVFNSVQPRLNIYKTIKDNHKFILEYKLQTAYPYLSDLNPQLTYQTPFVASMGNPELKPYRYHHFSLEYRKNGDGWISYFSIRPYYNYSDNEKGLLPIVKDNLIVYQDQNFVKHEHYGVESDLSFEIKEKWSLDIYYELYKDWNKNLNTPDIVDWLGSAQLSYTLNTKHYFGLMYQREYAKVVSSLGYTRDGVDFIMFYWMTLQAKGRLQLMLGYSLPLLPTQINETYEETPYYRKQSYTNVSIIKNLIMVNLVYRLSKGKVEKFKKHIDYENYDSHNSKKTISL